MFQLLMHWYWSNQEIVPGLALLYASTTDALVKSRDSPRAGIIVYFQLVYWSNQEVVSSGQATFRFIRKETSFVMKNGETQFLTNQSERFTTTKNGRYLLFPKSLKNLLTKETLQL
uniref:Uncharacterized protein n=1 Tax=Cacopsylla melanoneura TaxID=428564 RepID=A0A8D9B1R2_9HEMI